MNTGNLKVGVRTALATATVLAATGGVAYYWFRRHRGQRKTPTRQSQTAESDEMTAKSSEHDTKEELEQIFQDAVAFVRQAPAEAGFKPPQEQQLQLYALYKQATEGPCNIEAPSRLDFRNRAKWDAWNKLGQMNKFDAKNHYVGLLDELSPQWSSFDLDGTEVSPPTQPVDEAGVSVSTMKHALGENDTDEAGNTQEMDNFVKLIKTNEPDKLRDALKDVDVNAIRNTSGETLLHTAADEGNLNAVKALLERGAQIDAQEHEQGQTPLHYAILNDACEIAEFLVTKGADIYLKDCDGESPLDHCDSISFEKKLESLASSS